VLPLSYGISLCVTEKKLLNNKKFKIKVPPAARHAHFLSYD